jgi:hypothetical protein
MEIYQAKINARNGLLVNLDKPWSGIEGMSIPQ